MMPIRNLIDLQNVGPEGDNKPIEFITKELFVLIIAHESVSAHTSIIAKFQFYLFELCQNFRPQQLAHCQRCSSVANHL